MSELPRDTVLSGDAERVLAGLLPESVDCVITSPPYFRLRDYKAGARELGTEEDVEAWVGRLQAVFARLSQVLKPTGSVWLNLGDTYARHPGQGAARKSLLAAPERLLVALIADGWICRSKVVWAKPNPLPQSATDRPSPAHELVYFLTRSPRYFFDLDAIRVPHRSAHRIGRPDPKAASRRYQGDNRGLGALKAAGRIGHVNGKNPGDVWSIPTSCDRLGHQATFPQALVERCLLASCPERICVQCDRAWRRTVRIVTVHTVEGSRTVRKVGDLERCDCFAPARRGVVLDPFFGTGTVGVVAERLGRDWLGIELNPAYVSLAEHRLGIDERRVA